MTPPAHSACKARTWLNAPRALNEPVTCRDSSLSDGPPARAVRGVRTVYGAIRSRAACTSAREIIGATGARSARRPAQIGMASGTDLVQPVDRGSMRSGLDDLATVLGLARDREHRVGELIHRALAFCLRGLDHDRFFDDERKVNRRRVEPVIQQALGHVFGRDPRLLLLAEAGQHELVLTDPVVGEIK